METKEVKIECPEGFEIDKEKSSFEKIIFKKKEKKLPKTWEEYNGPRHSGKTIAEVPFGYREAFCALSKLIELRDCYNDGWKPNWNDDREKYSIFCIGGKIELLTRNTHSCILTFKSRELRNEFYNNFKDLIEQAKELI